MLPTVTGILTADDVAATIDSIAAEQLPSGLIPWARGVHGDAWNHTEAVMALALGGRWRETERAYDWLLGNQRADGSWHQYYLGDMVEEAKLDANICAYPAAGVWHQWLLTGDRGFIETMWPMVERAIDFVLDLQTPRGEIRWARHVDGTAWPFALLTGSSSISHSLRCAIALAEELGRERPDWELSAASLVRTIRHAPEAFQPKERWAMDWYYPVLAGAVLWQDARDRLDDGWDRFVLEGRGVRCVSDRPWVTAAETCECALDPTRPEGCSSGPRRCGPTTGPTSPASSSPKRSTSRMPSAPPTPPPPSCSRPMRSPAPVRPRASSSTTTSSPTSSTSNPSSTSAEPAAISLAASAT
jgi:hypothetical protein